MQKLAVGVKRVVAAVAREVQQLRVVDVAVGLLFARALALRFARADGAFQEFGQRGRRGAALGLLRLSTEPVLHVHGRVDVAAQAAQLCAKRHRAAPSRSAAARCGFGAIGSSGWCALAFESRR